MAIFLDMTWVFTSPIYMFLRVAISWLKKPKSNLTRDLTSVPPMSSHIHWSPSLNYHKCSQRCTSLAIISHLLDILLQECKIHIIKYKLIFVIHKVCTSLSKLVGKDCSNISNLSSLFISGLPKATQSHVSVVHFCACIAKLLWYFMIQDHSLVVRILVMYSSGCSILAT